MKKTHVISWLACLILTITLSVIWHVVLFEQAYQQLGVYTRMNDPIYEFGMLAWFLESSAFVIVYFQCKWSYEGISGGLKFGLWMAVFVSASVLIGAAAKTNISDLSLWFILTGGFLALHFSLMGVALGIINSHRREH
ncbi:hypothetical protein [Marinicella sp. W31]|uniref:hypothetical protein n=1 Tax=Marinicella sp. W31 TaxID=3023713 RepID=UPI003756729A